MLVDNFEMSKFFKKTKTVLMIAVIVVSGGVASTLFPQKAHALPPVHPQNHLSGYAWSSNIGWIDMSGVTVDTVTNAWSGYAWSSNIGWLSFLQPDLTSASIAYPDSAVTSMPCPSGAYTPVFNPTNNTVVGWGRFLSGGGPQS